MSKATILAGKELSKKYGDLEVVKNVSISVHAGEFVCLVGKSGCGKTTLLSLLSGLERPTRGDVVLNGKKINGASEDELALFRRKNVGFIFQSLNLILTLSGKAAWEISSRSGSGHLKSPDCWRFGKAPRSLRRTFICPCRTPRLWWRENPRE